ncbi:TetR/AcrR family transcriptional regulator [Mesorhizobium sp. 1M-11]|uniref:TetR/AcrR family transcriptional regulator n=1 Tax=Mesorhizobium sp. 1M-11 TaxID=1529006 RepID=UPI0006C76C8A|nr:TetR/AcrR family transcriptional regulator [Mesorhizobium sp. 1M-11]
MADRGRPRSFDRTEALERAMQVFWKKGYEGASLNDLTAAMGIGCPSLYAAFGSKENLFLEAIAHYESVVGTEIWEAIEKAPTARAAMQDFLHATVEAYSSTDSPRGCLIALGALHQDSSSGRICADLRRRRAENIDTLRRRLQRGVMEGDLPAAFDCNAAALFYATTQNGMSILARDGASREALAAVAEGAIAAFQPLADKANIRAPHGP